MGMVIRKHDIGGAVSNIPHGVKQSVKLAGEWGADRTVAVVVCDGVEPKAEVHEHFYDVWHVLKGSGSFILGGKLEGVEDQGNGELLGASIRDGEKFDIGEGDVIDIPPGVPHQMRANGRLEMLIVKVEAR